jgi:hypothetical protein
MLDITEQAVTLPEARVKELLFQGFTLQQIHERQIKKGGKKFIITRFNAAKNSVDYREEFTGKLFRAHFNRPLIIFRDTILRLAESGREGMEELYRMVIENSQIEKLEEKDAPVSTDFIGCQ